MQKLRERDYERQHPRILPPTHCQIFSFLSFRQRFFDAEMTKDPEIRETRLRLGLYKLFYKSPHCMRRQKHPQTPFANAAINERSARLPLATAVLRLHAGYCGMILQTT